MSVIKLREFRSDDMPLLLSCMNDSRVTQYITTAIPAPYTENDAKQWIAFCQGNPLVKAIEFEGLCVGCIEVKVGRFEYDHSGELGYWVAPEYWGRGIATQAMKLFGHSLFSETRLKRLFGNAILQNTASIRVLEKNNYQLEGTLKQASCHHGQFFDQQIWAQIAD